MKIFVIGGYGKTGIQAIKLLKNSKLITKIAIAGRNLERAEKAAAEIGEKAIGVKVDATDDQQLTLLTAEYDFIVNAATNDIVVPSIRTAIRNHAHYCDMSWGETLENALRLDIEAQAAGITAIIGTGISPCISNLMGVQAARRLDEVKQFQVGRVELINFVDGIDPTPKLWLNDPKDILTSLHDYRSFIGWMLNRLQNGGNRELIEPKDEKWVEIDPIKDGLQVPLAKGGFSVAHPIFSGDDLWGMAPADLAEEKPVEMWFSPFPHPLDTLLREQAITILRGEIDSEVAVSMFFETIAQDPYHWLTPPEGFSQIAKVWVRAVGCKEGRGAHAYCWFTAPMWYVGGWFLTSVALVAAVRMILRGEMKIRGVMTAEKAFEPLPFLDEVAALISDYLPEGKIIEESFKWLV